MSVVALIACEPRKKANGPPIATATTTPTATVAPKTTTPGSATTIGIPGFNLPTSPRAALVGKWNVAGVDGKGVPTAGMGTDPMDPATYVAGSGVTFTADTVTITRAGSTVYQHAYTVVSELPPVRVTIDAGYGQSNVDFGLDGSCVWSLPTAPPHALSLIRTP